MKFWDGLLGAEWIGELPRYLLAYVTDRTTLSESEVQQREQEFSTFRSLNILICSWNTDAQKPDTLTRKSANISFLKDVLRSVDKPDIIVFGFQELIDLENRSLTASGFQSTFVVIHIECPFRNRLTRRTEEKR